MSKSAGGGVRTFLYAGQSATSDHASGIKALLSRHGWHCVANENNGESCLELRGVKDIASLEQVLRSGGFISSKQPHASEDATRISTADRIRNNMLLVSGVLNVIADMGFLAYGFIKSKLPNQPRQNWEETAAGFTYTAGSGALTLFGRGDKSDHHISNICAKLRDKLLLDGFEIPEQCALRSFTNATAGTSKQIKQFLEKHPSEIGNGFYAVSGGLIAKGARKSADPKTRVIDTALGLTTLASGLTPVLVKEEAPDLTRPPPKGVIGKAVRWVAERPNRVAAYGYMVSTFAHTEETVRNLINAKKNYPHDTKQAYLAYGMRGMFTAFNLIAEVVMTFSSKGSGKGIKSDKSVDETAYAVIADAIVHQAPQKREQLIVDLSRNFLAKPEVLGGKASDIEALLRARVAKLAENPWSPEHRGNGQNQAAVAGPSPAEASRPGGWKEMLSAEALAARAREDAGKDVNWAARHESARSNDTGVVPAI